MGCFLVANLGNSACVCAQEFIELTSGNAHVHSQTSSGKQNSVFVSTDKEIEFLAEEEIEEENEEDETGKFSWLASVSPTNSPFAVFKVLQCNGKVEHRSKTTLNTPLYILLCSLRIPS